MKKNVFVFLLSTSLISAGAYSQDADSFTTVKKVTALMQTISQKILSDSMSMPTRSNSAISTEYYYKKMIEGIEKEVDIITGEKNPDQLSQEEKDIIQMLEIYIEQLKPFCPELAQ